MEKSLRKNIYTYTQTDIHIYIHKHKLESLLFAVYLKLYNQLYLNKKNKRTRSIWKTPTLLGKGGEVGL